MMRCSLGLLALLAAMGAGAQEISLHLHGKDIRLASDAQVRIEALAREMFSRCGPNTLQHAGNFGLSAFSTEKPSRGTTV